MKSSYAVAHRLAQVAEQGLPLATAGGTCGAAVFQELSLPLRCRRLRGNLLDLGIRQATDDDWGENPFETADDVTFDDLYSDVGDESLLRDL